MKYLDYVIHVHYSDQQQGETLMNQINSSTQQPKQGLAIAGLICGIIAFLFFPPLFGVLGIVFSSISMSAGNKLGKTALIVSVIGLIVGMIVGAMVFSG